MYMGKAIDAVEGAFSRNPADYDAQTQAIINGMGDVFYNGDRARAWAEYFDDIPTALQLLAKSRKAHSQAKLHLKAVPPTQ